MFGCAQKPYVDYGMMQASIYFVLPLVVDTKALDGRKEVVLNELNALRDLLSNY